MKNQDFNRYKKGIRRRSKEAIYKNAIGFNNEYIDFFSADAFDNRRYYIAEFYGDEGEGLERLFIYEQK